MEQELNELIEKMERLKIEQDCLKEEAQELLSEYNMLMAEAAQEEIDQEEKEEIMQGPYVDGFIYEKDNGLKEFLKVAGLMAVSAFIGYMLGSADNRAGGEVVYGE